MTAASRLHSTKSAIQLGLQRTILAATQRAWHMATEHAGPHHRWPGERAIAKVPSAIAPCQTSWLLYSEMTSNVWTVCLSSSHAKRHRPCTTPQRVPMLTVDAHGPGTGTHVAGAGTTHNDGFGFTHDCMGAGSWVCAGAIEGMAHRGVT